VVLDTLRRQLAIKVPYLDHDHQEAIRNNSYQYLREPWGLEEGEELESGPVFRVLPRVARPLRREIAVSPTSGLGRFLRRSSTWPQSLVPGQQLERRWRAARRRSTSCRRVPSAGWKAPARRPSRTR
jgi:hypothetical protein